uniref:FIIND domain-containing protein n=1 Tax=Monopterus albus TaxID=43700 RepID=A0A3Q3QHX1_MONAL
MDHLEFLVSCKKRKTQGRVIVINIVPYAVSLTPSLLLEKKKKASFSKCFTQVINHFFLIYGLDRSLILISLQYSVWCRARHILLMCRDASVRGQTYKAPPKQPAPQDTITDESCLKLDPKTATTKTKVSSCFTPDRVLDERGETSYRFKCPSPGVYQCASTQLVFKLTQKAELSYKIIQWDKIKPPLPSYKRPDKRPAGPLYHIECSEKAVAQLCLPHCEAQPAPPNEDLCVAHFRHGRMGILKPLKITDTHVVVNVPHLSALGLIWKWVKKFLNKKRIIGQVLLFHHPKFTEQLRKLNIFLLPANVPLREVKQEQENAEYIENPAFCVLTEGQTYTVRCSEAHEIHYSVSISDTTSSKYYISVTL